MSDSGAIEAGKEVVDSSPVVVTGNATSVLEVVADPPDIVVSTVSVAASVQAVRKTHSAIAASRISRR